MTIDCWPELWRARKSGLRCVLSVLLVLAVASCDGLAASARNVEMVSPTGGVSGTAAPMPASDLVDASRAGAVDGDQRPARRGTPPSVTPIPTPRTAPSHATPGSTAPARGSSGTARGTAPPTAVPPPPLSSTPSKIETVAVVIDGHDEGWSPCNPSVLGVLEEWFWENAVRWAADGSAVYFSQGPLVFEVAVDGSRTGVVADASSLWRRHNLADAVTQGPMTSFDIPPQGDRLVYATCAIEPHGRREQQEQPRYAIAVAELDGSPDRHLIESGGFANYPSWSPDGSRIAYLAALGPYKSSVKLVRKTHLEVVGANGSGQRRVFTGHPVVLHPPQWSPDGTRLAVVGTDGARFRHAVYTVGADGGKLRRLGRTISGPSWSPDGARLAFVGATDDKGASWNLLTVGPDGTGVRQVPLARGWEPHYVGGHSILTSLSEYRDGWIPTLAWSPAGDHLLYTCGRRICVVALDGTPVGRSPIEWYSGSVAGWSPDGAQIAVAKGAAWESGDLGSRGYTAMYTMAPDGTNVRVLAEFDADGEVRPKPLQPLPAIVAAASCQAGVAVADPSAYRGLVQDCAALLRVQAVWAPRLNWSSDRPMSDWVGVASSGSPPRVREFDVSGRGLRGPIPAALGQVTNLRYLDLSHNLLTGPIPVELSGLAGLREVRLAGNQLTGCVPPGLPVSDREELELPDCEAGA